MRRAIVTAIELIALLLAAHLWVEAIPQARGSQLDDDLLVVSANFSQHTVAPDASIEFQLSRELSDAEKRIAILIANTDVSSLFTKTKLRLQYNAQLWPLPAAESNVTIYIVTMKDEWKELAQFKLRVNTHPTSPKQADNEVTFTKTRFRLPDSSDFLSDLKQQEQTDSSSAVKHANRKLKFLPSLTLSLKSQPAESTFPTPASSQPRDTFADVTMQSSLKSEATYGLFNSQSSFDFAGSSFEQEALRFGTLGEAAPKVDLSSYLVQFQTGKIKYQLGHFAYGTQRQLINSFSSRGLMVTVPFLKRFDFSVAAMNGTQLVGYDNFFGLNKSKHQMLSGTLGVEFFPKRPGGLRVEVGVLNAYFQPISGVNRGVVTDTQRSRGVALRLIANDKTGRFHFEGGFTRSLFISPNDVTLSQGATLVPLPSLARNAHFLEASYDVLRTFSLTKTRKANLRVGFREENVAPLFRSLGAFTQADKVFYEVSVDGSVNEITAQFGRNNFHDNLRNIPSILRTLNNTTRFALAAPTSALLAMTKSRVWLPRLGYNFNRIHAFGAAIPVNGGFGPTSIPDLIGTVQTLSADWLIKKFTIGYFVNHSLQNNRQAGRELADQTTTVNGGRLAYLVNSRLNLNLDLSTETSHNIETNRVDRNTRLGPGFIWQLTRHLGIGANLSNTIAGDAARISHSRNTEFDSQLTYRLERGEGLKKVSAQFFLRYANHYSHFIEQQFFIDNLSKIQTLTANFSLTFF